jgi:hypothetical protein
MSPRVLYPVTWKPQLWMSSRSSVFIHRSNAYAQFFRLLTYRFMYARVDSLSPDDQRWHREVES